MFVPGDETVQAGPFVVWEAEAADLRAVRDIAQRLASAARRGDLILLYGPLGAGKTTLVRMLAEELGVVDQVRSPSFTIANIYDGPIPLFHLDLYRLEELDEEDVLALEEYVSPEAITVVEWPEVGRTRLGDPVWTVRLGHRDPETRTVLVEAGNEGARARWEEAA